MSVLNVECLFSMTLLTGVEMTREFAMITPEWTAWDAAGREAGPGSL